jgi:hypothetical protein
MNLDFKVLRFQCFQESGFSRYLDFEESRQGIEFSRNQNLRILRFLGFKESMF